MGQQYNYSGATFNSGQGNPGGPSMKAISADLGSLYANSYGSGAPASPVPGQLWLNSATQQLCVYSAGGWSPIATATPVTAFGADPTGQNPSAADIQACFASGAMAVSVPAGNYLCEAGVDFNNPNPGAILLFYGATLTASPGVITPGTPLLTISANDCRVYNPSLDGKFTGTTCIANGINITGDQVRLYAPTVTHFPLYGVTFSAGSTDCYMYGQEIQQWMPVDVPYATQGNLTAHGILFAGAYCFVYGGYSRLSLNPVAAASTAGACWVYGTHLYNGNASAAFTDPRVAIIDAGAASITFDGCTFESGHVDCFSPNVQLIGCRFVQDVGSCIFSAGNETMVRVFCPANGTDPSLFSLRGTVNATLPSTNSPASSVATTILGFYSTGGNSWAGDYSGLAAQIANSDYSGITVSRGESIITVDSTQATPAQENYRPGGYFDYYWATGDTANPVQLDINSDASPSNATVTYTVDNLILLGNHSSAASLVMGGSTGGFIESSPGSPLFLGVNGVLEMELLHSGSAWQPFTDNSVSDGGGSNRYTVVYATNGTINTSDSRHKEATPLALGLDFILALEPIEYTWKVAENIPVRQVFRDPQGNDVPESWTGFIDGTGAPYTGKTTLLRPALKDAKWVDPQGNVVKKSWRGWVDTAGKALKKVGAERAEVQSTQRKGVRVHAGLTAQQVKATLPKEKDYALWSMADPKDPDSTQGLNYGEVVPILVKAQKEAVARSDTALDALRAEIASLRAEVAALKAAK